MVFFTSSAISAGCRCPRCGALIENLRPVEVAKGSFDYSSRATRPARCSSWRKAGRPRFLPVNGTQKNLAFYRDGDFFGELSILEWHRPAPHQSKHSAIAGCSRSSHPRCAIWNKRYPEFGRLMEERLAQYEAKTEARVPLDFDDRDVARGNAQRTTRSRSTKITPRR